MTRRATSAPCCPRSCPSGLAAYMWKVRVIITTDVERVSIALSPGLRQVFRWTSASATPVHIGMGSGIGYRMTGPGMRVILASPGDGVRFRLHDGREVSVATPRRDEPDRTRPAAGRRTCSERAGGPVKNGVRLSWIIDVSSVFQARCSGPVMPDRFAAACTGTPFAYERNSHACPHRPAWSYPIHGRTSRRASPRWSGCGRGTASGSPDGRSRP